MRFFFFFESVLCVELSGVVTDGVEIWELTFCVVLVSRIPRVTFTANIPSKAVNF